MARLDRLALTDFRNYRHLAWRPEAPVTVVTGENGSGKTNLLEALSLLVPGRGLRGARSAEMARHGTTIWGVAARFTGPDGAPFDIATGSDPARPERRVFRRDGETLRSRAALADHLSAVWLTPQMDRLFQDGLPGRRRFLDRLVLALEPGHARELAAHDQAMGQRNRLLAAGRADPGWLSALEDSMARHAVAASAARLALVTQLNGEAAHTVPDGFPPARLDILCPIVQQLRDRPALAVEDWLRGRLAAGRAADGARGGAGMGAHRADMALSDQASGRPAAQASTGQQKALLLGVVLAHAALMTRSRGEAPMILLDEPLVHLDEARRAALFRSVGAFDATVLMTGTDADQFAPLRGRAGFVSPRNGALDGKPV
ncbi:DNA replication and repair protein RecF [Gluconacetobacter diazotrophicus PA1 5]|uniref:DNA replication/repair protein RecF n=1 Tax=Gluconacetobacter diazotrophicus TaxID=33996 RepID=UPI000173CA2C|nr:DNA replication/repair protein RecF [Gluconacetobacter diazotrophicus]ACI49805.1 DNA replication and repair protein RecF [Gluconacetobacter diazotrophicus PA1 5]TWB10346.1 DNA replication and repair protein RecF [Gluconacetobacter diazotrophicus]